MSSSRRPTSYMSSKLPLRLPPAMAGPLPKHRRALFSAGQSPRISSGAPVRLAETAGPPVDGVALTLPVPPSVNHQYATVDGRRLLSSVGRAYKRQVGQLVWLSLSQHRDCPSLLTRLQSEPLALSIRFYFTSALRRDVDGGLKIAQDALCEGLGINDNRIIETHLYKQVDRDRPRIEISLSVAPAAP